MMTVLCHLISDMTVLRTHYLCSCWYHVMLPRDWELSLPSFILYFNTYISGGFNKLEIELCEQTKYLLEIKYFKKSGDC